MLKHVFMFCFLVCLSAIAYCEQERWSQHGEREILQLAQQQNLPVIAIFLGKQGCPWSQKLQDEVLKSPQWTQEIRNEALFWQIDSFESQNDQILRDKYNIQTFPLIVLLDPQGKEFARMEYVPLDALGYVAEIRTLIEDFQELCIALEAQDEFFDEEKLQTLYLKAKKMSAPYFKLAILEKGLQVEKGAFFHLEKLAMLLQSHKLKHPLVLKAKKQLQERDPDNHLGTHFKIAVLEFDKIVSKHKRKDHFEKPLIPLLQFVHKFGKTDKENLWKAELMIAEYLYKNNFVEQAYEHAEMAYVEAPEAFKPQIVESIAYMKRKPSY
jgi:hypothetical protein